jgi:hypothetical protein
LLNAGAQRARSLRKRSNELPFLELKLGINDCSNGQLIRRYWRLALIALPTAKNLGLSAVSDDGVEQTRESAIIFLMQI